jgi:hypothetical protein
MQPYTPASPWVPRTEIGEAAAVVLTTSGHEHKAYAITADIYQMKPEKVRL